MAASREIFDAQIVLSGEFTPAIFSPDWFARHNLIGNEDVEAAREGTLVVAREATTFQTDWFSIQVLQQQVVFTSLGPVTPLLKDLAAGVLMILPETQVAGVGLNFRAHYRTPAKTEYHRIGDTLAPKDIWNALFPGMHVGLANLQIMAQKVNDEGIGVDGNQYHVFVQPSNLVEQGVFVATNDHRSVVADSPKQPSGEKAAQIIRNDWEAAWHRAMDLADQLLTKAIGD